MIAFFVTSSTSGTGKALFPITATNGNTYYSNGYVTLAPYFGALSSSSTIRIGSGTTPATINDYNLESMLSSGFTSTISKEYGLDSDNNPYVTFTIAVSNTSSSAMTIGEIGLFLGFGASSTQYATSQTSSTVMVDRTVLDSPITIPAGEAATITYTLKSALAS